MKLDNEFTVGVPIEQAWGVLTDLELIAPCMPGAQLTGVNDGVYSGKVKIKVGPVTAEYAGTAQFSVKDETAYRAVIDARGRDSRGNGNATAVISAQLQPAGESTIVTVSTDLTIAGRVAQFGGGMIKEVSAKLLGQFVTCLEGKLSAGAVSQPAVAAAEGTGAAGGAAATSAPASAASTASTASDNGQAAASSAPASTMNTAGTSANGAGQSAGTALLSAEASLPAAGPEPAALDLMGVAGRAIFKRLAPLVIGLIVLAVIIYLLVR
jgi:carbon monoxide dehydrogenase subunit G